MPHIKEGFELELPDGWEDRTVYTFLGPDESGHQHLLTVAIDREIGDIELWEFAQPRIDATLSAVPSATVIKNEESVLPSGRPIYELVYKWVPADKKILFHRFVYMIINGVGYTFSASFTKRTLKTIYYEVEKIIDSFEPQILSE